MFPYAIFIAWNNGNISIESLGLGSITGQQWWYLVNVSGKFVGETVDTGQRNRLRPDLEVLRAGSSGPGIICPMPFLQFSQSCCVWTTSESCHFHITSRNAFSTFHQIHLTASSLLWSFQVFSMLGWKWIGIYVLQFNQFLQFLEVLFGIWLIYLVISGSVGFKATAQAERRIAEAKIWKGLTKYSKLSPIKRTKKGPCFEIWETYESSLFAPWAMKPYFLRCCEFLENFRRPGSEHFEFHCVFQFSVAPTWTVTSFNA